MSDPQEEAVSWYRKAAEQGDAEAQFLLGECYRDGKGVPQDLTEAKRWFQTAANTGHQGAITALAQMQPPAPAVTNSSRTQSSTPAPAPSSSSGTNEGRGCVIGGIAGLIAFGLIVNATTRTVGALWWTETRTDWGAAWFGAIVVAIIAYNIGKSGK